MASTCFINGLVEKSSVWLCLFIFANFLEIKFVGNEGDLKE